MDVASLFDLLKAGGGVAVSAILFYVWYEERKENRELRKTLNEVNEKVLTTVVTQANAMSKLEGSITGLKDVLTQALGHLRG